MIVDADTHIMSDDRQTYPLNPADSSTGAWDHQEPCTIEQLLAFMDADGVDRVLLVQWINAYQFDNRYAADCGQRFPERCAGVACVDVSSADPVTELRRLVTEKGMRALRFGGGGGDKTLAEQRVMWETAETLGIPVTITTMPAGIPEIVEALPVVPALPVAIDHCAFSYPGGEHWDELMTLAKFPNIYMKVTTYGLKRAEGVGTAPAALVADLASRFGADRLIWGSGYSPRQPLSYAELVAYGRRACAQLDDEQRAWYLGRTALKLWPELAH